MWQANEKALEQLEHVERLERVEHLEQMTRSFAQNFFAKFAGQGHFVAASLIISISYLVLTHGRTKHRQADKKTRGTLGQ